MAETADRTALRRESLAQLAETRAALLDYVQPETTERGAFPRSATMRWLLDRDRLSRMTLSVLAYAAFRAGMPGLGRFVRLPGVAGVLVKWLRR